ncbi:Uncharacterised protein [Amycolatopsis camponoti]|uniref:Uncharacterized protein n=1 Tax=Amycolatopsis camponoti TaxID=2606593 RepID=A0A6I8LSD5_9PSEU|nr:hypothetical protein [Amycolatopsis camponoti]VVJ19911.1 Uncharacterised protein [Amycolatopsis camponoti]
MAANEKREDPDAELAHSRQLINEAKEAAAKADLADSADEETDPSGHEGDAGSE